MSFSAKPSRTRAFEDPPLTETDHAQSQELAEQFTKLDISRIIVSYTRALQTAHAVANRLGVPMTVDVNVRERTAYICDVGTETPALAADWPHLDFSLYP